MKKLLLIATALTIIISSCNQKKKVTSKIIIAGNLKNYDAKEVSIWNIYQENFTSSIEDGNFKITLDAEAAEIYDIDISLGESLRVSRDETDKEKYIAFNKKRNERSFFQFFLSPGDSIYLTADFLEPNAGLKVSGNNSAENTYLFEKRKLFFTALSGNLIDYQTKLYSVGLIGGNFRPMMPIMGLEKDQYFHKKDSFFNAYKSRFEALKAGKAINPAFVKLEEAYFIYEPLVLDLDYTLYYARIHRERDTITGQINMDDIDFPTDDGKAALAELDLSRNDLLSSRPYTSLVYKRIDDATSEIMKQDSTLKNNYEGYIKANMMAIDRLPIDQVIKDYFLYSTITTSLIVGGPSEAKAVYEKFIKEHESPELAAKLQKIYNKWNAILPGMEVPDFSFIDIERNSVKLSDLHGNLVYIDLWATWCKPCIAQHPHLDKLREEYKDKAVSFLNISLDTKKETWEKMVYAKNMEGLQWYAPGDFKSELATHFMVRGIPRFILLDREGKIIDPAADRPSGNIRAMLDQHL